MTKLENILLRISELLNVKEKNKNNEYRICIHAFLPILVRLVYSVIVFIMGRNIQKWALEQRCNYLRRKENIKSCLTNWFGSVWQECIKCMTYFVENYKLVCQYIATTYKREMSPVIIVTKLTSIDLETFPYKAVNPASNPSSAHLSSHQL